MSEEDIDSFQLDPTVPIKLKGKEYTLEINNFAVKGVYKDTKYNLLSTAFDKNVMQDPEVMGSMLYWGLKTHHPEITQEESDKLFSYKNSVYVLRQLLKSIDYYLPKESRQTTPESESNVKVPT